MKNLSCIFKNKFVSQPYFSVIFCIIFIIKDGKSNEKFRALNTSKQSLNKMKFLISNFKYINLFLFNIF
jgi:hypothetical protein